MLIGNLPFDTSEKELFDFFASIGKVSHIELLKDKIGRCKGFAFVTMADHKQKEDLISVLDNSQFKGRVLSVSVAKPLPQLKRTSFISKLCGGG
jgi:RNA recognition motif-containing protein